jgi:hypothetical protein
VAGVAPGVDGKRSFHWEAGGPTVAASARKRRLRDYLKAMKAWMRDKRIVPLGFGRILFDLVGSQWRLSVGRSGRTFRSHSRFWQSAPQFLCNAPASRWARCFSGQPQPEGSRPSPTKSESALIVTGIDRLSIL